VFNYYKIISQKGGVGALFPYLYPRTQAPDIMNKERKIIEISEYLNGTEDGWELIKVMSFFKKVLMDGIVKNDCGNIFLGKKFRVAYKETENGRCWIKANTIVY